MTVMASGSDIAFERLAPVLEAVAGKVYRIGAEPGLGSTVKIIHQLLAGVHIAAGAEAMALAARAGIPLDVMYDVVTNAAGNSWMFENRMRHVVDGDYTPHSAVDIFVKDLGLVANHRTGTPVVEATQQSLAALSWLQQQGCKQIYFKYCSTFDSTAKGNIGPVTDALMDALDTPFTVFSPALPVNGRTVYQGYLFVMNQLLAESGMRHHPVNPMTDSYLPRLPLRGA